MTKMSEKRKDRLTYTIMAVLFVATLVANWGW
jgi:hypothetical protein